MSKTYRLEAFEDRITIDDDEQIVTARLERAAPSAMALWDNYALVGPADSPSEGVDEEPRCGYEGCQRRVSDSDERCWQHEND